MAKLTDLDPRLAGWDDEPKHGHCCALCQRSEFQCVLDTYEGNGETRLICDDCICAEIDRVEARALPVSSPVRPEGYYHYAPGTFD
jgi:hypothetical protein